jgi:hypothetical protein
MSVIKSTGGEPRVFHSHKFNTAALQSSTEFQERLKCSKREFVGYVQTVNSNMNKDESLYRSHDPQTARTNSLNFQHILLSYIGTDNVYNIGLLEDNLLMTKIKTQIM